MDAEFFSQPPDLQARQKMLRESQETGSKCSEGAEAKAFQAVAAGNDDSVKKLEVKPLGSKNRAN